VTGNSAKLRKLGWKSVTSLEQAVKRTKEFYGI